jgi:hypothetical protein
MRSLLAAIVLVAAGAAAQAESDAWKFRVLLDGSEIGRHDFVLHATDQGRELRSQARLDVRVLFVSVYSYVHDAVERWDGNCLQSLSSRTQTNGERESVNATVRAGRLLVERGDTRDQHEGCVMTFAYWNPQVLKAQRLLNSQTGELVPVTVTARGQDTIQLRGQPLAAQRFRISGPSLQIDLWYAGERWVGLEAPAQGGRRLRYELI